MKPTPAQLLRAYQERSDPDMTAEVERIISLGTKDILRLLAYMAMHTAAAVQMVNEAAGADALLENLSDTTRSQ